MDAVSQTKTVDIGEGTRENLGWTIYLHPGINHMSVSRQKDNPSTIYLDFEEETGKTCCVFLDEEKVRHMITLLQNVL